MDDSSQNNRWAKILADTTAKQFVMRVTGRLSDDQDKKFDLAKKFAAALHQNLQDLNAATTPHAMLSVMINQLDIAEEVVMQLSTAPRSNEQEDAIKRIRELRDAAEGARDLCLSLNLKR